MVERDSGGGICGWGLCVYVMFFFGKGGGGYRKGKKKKKKKKRKAAQSKNIIAVFCFDK